MSHFPTSQPTTAFFPKLECIQFSLQKLQMLTPVHNDADNAKDSDDAYDVDNADSTDDYYKVLGMALVKAFSCAKKWNVYQPFVTNAAKSHFPAKVKFRIDWNLFMWPL